VAFLVRCLIVGVKFFFKLVNMYINSCVIFDPALFCTLVLKMQRVSLLGRNGNISVLWQKAVLRRNLFTMEEHVKGNVVPCLTVGEREQEEVMKLRIFNECWLPIH
jgi:hypothetical protein